MTNTGFAIRTNRGTYYKATRPDGTDFYTGTVDYAAALTAGTPVMHPAPDLTADADRYLSVATVPTDCTGMAWPCRLFEVSPVGEVRKSSGLPNKRRVKGLHVVAELEAWQVFGPQGIYVASLIDRAGRLTRAEVYDLRAARDAAWDAAGLAARDAAGLAARDAARVAAGDAARVAAWDAARGAAGDAAWAAAGVAAGVVARDLIGKHGFTQEHYDLLTGAWRQVIGPVHPDDPDLRSES